METFTSVSWEPRLLSLHCNQMETFLPLFLSLFSPLAFGRPAVPAGKQAHPQRQQYQISRLPSIRARSRALVPPLPCSQASFYRTLPLNSASSAALEFVLPAASSSLQLPGLGLSLMLTLVEASVIAGVVPRHQKLLQGLVSYCGGSVSYLISF
jgi:hypothetical protein